MRYGAYGIEVESDFPVPSLSAAGDVRPAVALQLRVATEEEVELRAPSREGRCVERIVHPDGEVGLEIREHASGFRMDAGPFGRYFLGADPLVADCAPAAVERWRRERFLVARVLPIAALLQGHEVLHAGAAQVGGFSIAVLGPSGAGKSSIALRLSLLGLPILTDDLLSVASVGEQVLAYPGTRLLGIRDPEYRLLSERERARLGNPVDRGDKHYGQVEPAAAPAPLRLLYRLRRTGEPTGGVVLEPAGAPDPQLLLGSTFFAQLQLTDERLTRQLDLYRRLARQAELVEVRIPAGVTAAEVATEIAAHASARAAEPLSA